jgi:WD40 repeat protein
LKYSDGGQYLAVAYKKKQASTMGMDKYQVSILDSFTTAPLYPTIDSHHNHVVEMFWQNMDLELYTCGADGKFFIWKLEEGQCVPKEAKQIHGQSYTTMASDGKEFIFIAGLEGNQGIIKRYHKDNVSY